MFNQYVKTKFYCTYKNMIFDFQNPYLTDSNKIQEVDLFFLTLK